MISLIAAAALAGASPSPEAPVSVEIVFDVCRAGWPDWPRTTGAREFRAQADFWTLTKEERDYVQTQCSRIAEKLRLRLGGVTFDHRGKVLKSSPR